MSIRNEHADWRSNALIFGHLAVLALGLAGCDAFPSMPPPPAPIVLPPAKPLDSPPAGAVAACAPVPFTSEHIEGVYTVDPLFVPYLSRLAEYAAAAKVKIVVPRQDCSSFRIIQSGCGKKSDTRSNHLIGHAIDFNLKYGAGFGEMCTSKCLLPSTVPEGSSNEEILTHLPDGVRLFMALVLNDSAFRWLADLKDRNGNPTPDPVHIDDGLNLRDPSLWAERYDAMRGKGPACQPSCQPGNCRPGYCPAINAPSKCCPSGYRYYWADDRCHRESPEEAASQNCPPAGWVPCTCPQKHYCVSVNCRGTWYHSDGITCDNDFHCR